MTDIIASTYKLLDVMDESDLIKEMEKYKKRIECNSYILEKVKLYNSIDNLEEKIKIKKELYNNLDYKRYMECYNELSLIVLKIDKQYKKYTSTKIHNC